MVHITMTTLVYGWRAFFVWRPWKADGNESFPPFLLGARDREQEYHILRTVVVVPTGMISVNCDRRDMGVPSFFLNALDLRAHFDMHTEYV